MELFSLGIGHYTEKDIREAARAFTGWEIQGGKAVFNAEPARRRREDRPRPDAATGSGDDIVRICLEQKSCAVLHRRQAVPLPDQRDGRRRRRELLEPLADAVPQERLRLRRAGQDGAALEPVLLAGRLPHAGQVAGRFRARHRPRRWRAGSARRPWRQALEELGQNVFYPPSVKGWDGGPAWLNGQTLLFRQNLALALTSTEDARFGRRTDPAALARKHGKKTRRGAGRLLPATCSCRATCRPSRATACCDYQQQAAQADDAGLLDRGRTPPTTASARCAIWC